MVIVLLDQLTLVSGSIHLMNLLVQVLRCLNIKTSALKIVHLVFFITIPLTLWVNTVCGYLLILLQQQMELVVIDNQRLSNLVKFQKSITVPELLLHNKSANLFQVSLPGIVSEVLRLPLVVLCTLSTSSLSITGSLVFHGRKLSYIHMHSMPRKTKPLCTRDLLSLVTSVVTTLSMLVVIWVLKHHGNSLHLP